MLNGWVLFWVKLPGTSTLVMKMAAIGSLLNVMSPFAPDGFGIQVRNPALWKISLKSTTNQSAAIVCYFSTPHPTRRASSTKLMFSHSGNSRALLTQFLPQILPWNQMSRRVAHGEKKEVWDYHHALSQTKYWMRIWICIGRRMWGLQPVTCNLIFSQTQHSTLSWFKRLCTWAKGSSSTM